MKHWSITVAVDGENVLTIDSVSLSGIPDVAEFADEIRTAAEHVLAFIGKPDDVQESPRGDIPF